MMNSFNTTLQSENDYEAGRQDGIDEVLLALDDILSEYEGAVDHKGLKMEVARNIFDRLAKQFPARK